MEKAAAPRIFIAALLILLAAVSLLFVRELRINKSYVAYEKLQTQNDLYSFATCLLETNKILNATLQKGKITVGDANLLSSDLYNQSDDFTNIERREQIQNKYPDETTAFASNMMSMYVSKNVLHVTYGCFDTYSPKRNDVIALDGTQKALFEKMAAINGDWLGILRSYGLSGNQVGNDFNNKFQVSDYTYWYKLIDDYVAYSRSIDKGLLETLKG